MFFKGRPIRGAKVEDIMWFRHDGEAMRDQDWDNPSTSSLGFFLSGGGLDDVDDRGLPLLDDDVLVFLNGADCELDFTIPTALGAAPAWHLVVDSAEPGRQTVLQAGAQVRLIAKSLMAFRRALPKERVLTNPGFTVATKETKR
jgi:glycogen operon protein